MFSWLLEGLTGATPNTALENVSVRALPRDITMTAGSYCCRHRCRSCSLCG